MKNFTPLGENDDKDAHEHWIHVQSSEFSRKYLKSVNQRCKTNNPHKSNRIMNKSVINRTWVLDQLVDVDTGR